MRATVELGEVQGNVLRRYPRALDSALHVRLRLDDVAAARGAVAGWLRERVSFEGDPEALPARVNLAFTYEGLEEWGVPGPLRLAFPQDFREGARRRAEGLGDRWPRDEARFGPAHLLLSVHAEDGERCGKVADELLPAAGLAEVGERRLVGYEGAGVGSGGHFGFADGLSQPAIEGVDVDPVGTGVLAGLHRRRGSLLREQLSLRPLERRWRLIRSGEFLLGYENEDDELPEGPPAPLGPNGTFMVYREIEQHVDVFEEYLATWAPRLSMSPHALRAKIVGRWPGGTPTSRHPGDDVDAERDDPGNLRDADLQGRQRRLNDFGYAEDPDGWGCPLGAHIRRGNPRDALPGGGERTMRHRMIRRGLPYGREGQERGLAFVCFGASIARGFEYVQRHWIDGGDAFGLGRQPDFLLQRQRADGEPLSPMVIQGYAPTVLPAPPGPFVTVRGCDYLFVPSRRACAWLADLRT